jgi:DNA-directed RNA polymerase I subunit RPA2
MTEIAFIPSPQGAVAGQYPGIFIFTGAARMMRPVFNIAAKAIEYIGTLEQVKLLLHRKSEWNSNE